MPLLVELLLFQLVRQGIATGQREVVVAPVERSVLQHLIIRKQGTKRKIEQRKKLEKYWKRTMRMTMRKQKSQTPKNLRQE